MLPPDIVTGADRFIPAALGVCRDRKRGQHRAGQECFSHYFSPYLVTFETSGVGKACGLRAASTCACIVALSTADS